MGSWKGFSSDVAKMLVNKLFPLPLFISQHVDINYINTAFANTRFSHLYKNM